MKFVLTICLLLVSTPSIAGAPPHGKQRATLTRAQMREAERRLADLGYWTGAVDGRLDIASQSALIAFQKWEGRPITSQLTLDELEAIRGSSTPKARDAGYSHVEVDVDRQVLLLIDKAGRVRVLPVSTGSGKPFKQDGENSVAYTPRGRFVVYDKVAGWTKGGWERCITQITSAAEWPYTAIRAFRINRQVMAVYEYLCLPLGKSASCYQLEQSCWCMTGFRSCRRRPGLRTRASLRR